MHNYIRTVGFRDYSRQELEELLSRLAKETHSSCSLPLEDGRTLTELRAETAPGMGITLVGELDQEGQFLREYYFPYVDSTEITSTADCTIERHTERETYAGLLDEYRVGISLIFYMNNSMEYRLRRFQNQSRKPQGAALSGLAAQGKILLPVAKTKLQAENSRKAAHNRNRLLEAAKRGDEVAIETLTVEDIDLYTQVSRRIAREDIYSIIDTCFMPCGVECDQYSVIGEITAIDLVTNRFTGEEIYKLRLLCNDLDFQVAVNQADLLGEPQIGRRFKGQIWMQGSVKFQS